MSNKHKAVLAAVLFAVGIVGRLMPHAWNFTPVAAIGLFAGGRLGSRYGLLLPVAIMIASDAMIGFYDWQINLAVYLSIALSGAIGWLLRKRSNPLAITTGSVASSLAFFLITNTAVWAFGTMYPSTGSGLLASLAAGIPFVKNTILGDLAYSLAFFWVYDAAASLIKQIQEKKMLTGAVTTNER